MQAYYKRLTSTDAEVRQAAARAWSIWEGATSKLFPSQDMIARFGEDQFAEAFARIECHYFVNNGFFEQQQLAAAKTSTASATSPPSSCRAATTWSARCKSAWDLHRAWPEADLQIVADAGHSASEAGTLSRLVQATDKFCAQ